MIGTASKPTSETQAEPEGKLEPLLSRDQVAVRLTEYGYPTSVSALAHFVRKGGGPPFCRYGKHTLYKWEDAVAWARSRMRPAEDHYEIKRRLAKSEG